jgi:hypothetical protein
VNDLELFQCQVPDFPHPLASREGILHMEAMMMASPLCENWEPDFPLTHRFADGVYAREMLIPEGSYIIGKIHRFGHLNVITKGEVSVLTEFGVDHLVAPCTFVSKPGTKRVVYAHEDTVWTTFHGTQHTDPDKVEADIICKSFEDFDQLALLEGEPA